MNILDLPLEKQKQIALEEGYTSFEKWVEDQKEFLLEDKTDTEKVSVTEIRSKIALLRSNPNQIYFYRRIYGDDELTVDAVIQLLESQIKNQK